MSDSAWLVTSGEYSDFRVRCAAPSEEVANQIADHMAALSEHGDGYAFDVLEVPVLTEQPRRYAVLTVGVRFASNGSASPPLTHSVYGHWSFEEPEPPMVWSWRPEGILYPLQPGGAFKVGWVSVTGVGYERVLAVLAERQAAILADESLWDSPVQDRLVEA